MATGSPSAQTALARASVPKDSHGTRFERGYEEQIATLYRLAPGYYLVTLVAAGLVCAVLQSQIDPVRLWGWLGAGIVLTAIRFILLWHYRHARTKAAELRTWATSHVLTSVLAGIFWGLSAHLLAPSNAMPLQAFVYIVLAGMMAGAALSSTVYLPAFLAFVLPIGVLVLVRLMTAASLDHEDGRAMSALAMLLVIWVGITWYFARNANHSYLRALRLDRENRALDSLASTRIVQIENSNRMLAAEVASREAMEVELRRTKEQLELALSASRLSIWDWTTERNLVYLDPMWSVMLGGAAQAQHSTVEALIALVHPEDLAAVRSMQIACLKGEAEEYSVEHRVRKADGGWIWIMSRGRVEARDDTGRVTRMIGTNLDITERMNAEARIETLNRALEARLSRLTDVNRDLQHFSSMASHDLHAPLRRIKGFAALLQERLEPTLDDEGRHLLRRLRHNATRMSTLIEDLLMFARSSRAELSLQEVDLEPLVREVVSEIGEARNDRHIEWLIPSLPRVSADRALLKVAFVNLIDNAVKFTRKQPASRIEIGATIADSEDVVYVCDNGVGFDARGTEQVFVAFRRLHSEAEFEGNGIGLATVHRIVERHGGRVWARSAIGQGATFYMALPRQSASSAHGAGGAGLGSP